jgi:hypothetical protein
MQRGKAETCTDQTEAEKDSSHGGAGNNGD